MNNSSRIQWPVIINQSLDGTQLLRILMKNELKLRVSSSTLPDTVIFPLSSVAYMLLNIKPIMERTRDLQQVYQSIQKFVDVHARCYLLVTAPLFGDTELKIYSRIQMKFMRNQLQIIPVHNSNEAVESMLTTAKVLCKPDSDVMMKRLESIEDQYKSYDVMAAILQQIGLDQHQIQVIQDSIGSLASLATSDKEDLLNCSLDTQTVSKILGYFGNNI